MNSTNQISQVTTDGLLPVRAVREGSPYRVPRHPAPMDLMLDGNEGQAPPASLLQSLASQSSDVLFRYPKTGSLEQTLAKRLGISPEEILVTAGADDGIDRVCRTMLSEGREALVPWPTFEMMIRYASVAGGKVRKIPWVPGQDFPVEAMIEQATPETGLLMIVSPNNPTGSIVTAEQIMRLSETLPHVLILLDLAYIEFADIDLTRLALELPNVVVTRTLSKAWGLAGLRVGYAISCKKIINWLRVAGEPYAVAGPSLFLAEERIRTGETDVSAFVSFVKKIRTSLESLLHKTGAKVIPSQGNFVFAQVDDSMWLRDAMAGMGIGIRAFPGKADLERSIRITCPRNDAQAERLTHALQTILSPEAILFDMDGVLADVSASYRQAIIATAATFGVAISPKEITQAKDSGNANNDWILTQRMLQKRGVIASLDDVTAVFESFYQGTVEQPGLWEKETLLVTKDFLLDLAQRFPLAIVTGRPRNDAVRFLEQYDLCDCFRTLVCMEDATAKPDPAPVKLAMKQLGVQRAWFLGDTPDDIHAGRGANVLPLGLVAPCDDVTQATQVLLESGAARVLSNVSCLKELLP